MIYQIIQNSQIPTYQLLWETLNSNEDNFAYIDEGVKRVLKGNGKYAFLAHDIMIEYESNRNCNLTQIGGTLNDESYAFALPRGNSFINWAF